MNNESNKPVFTFRALRGMRPVDFGALMPLLLSTALFGGCAGVAVDRAKDVSSAGIAYTQATAAVIDVAVDASIDFDSNSLLQTARAQPAERTAQLNERDVPLVRSTLLYSRLKRSINVTQAYFAALQQLADGSTADATETAVKALADRLNGVNQALDNTGSGAALISAEKRDAIGGLAKVVAKQIHGAKLATALERDAPTVGRALALQNKVLETAAEDIRNHLNNEAVRGYRDRVQRPFAAGTMERTAWMEDRKAFLKIQALGQTQQALNSAQASAAQMETVWARIVSGEYSAKELTAMLKDTEDLLAAANALKDVTKAEAAAKAKTDPPN
jgi:hypothetical protein